MSYGVVPLVSNVEGARRIIDNGINGFVFEHTKNGLDLAMTKALSLTNDEYNKMSEAAIQKIKNEFSCDYWCKHYQTMINSL